MAKEITQHIARTSLVFVSAGETEEETVVLMKDAIEFHLEGLKEDRMPIPEPTISTRSLEIAV